MADKEIKVKIEEVPKKVQAGTWKKEIRPKLENIAEEQGHKIKQQYIDYHTSRNIRCETCQQTLSSNWCYTISTDDQDMPRYFCQSCGDIITVYFSQIHGIDSDAEERWIYTMRRVNVAQGTLGRWKVEFVFSYFGERPCTNCVYEKEVLKKPINENRLCYSSMKLLESDFKVDDVIRTTVSYWCKECTIAFMKELERSSDDIIGVEANVAQKSRKRLEAKIEEINKWKW